MNAANQGDNALLRAVGRLEDEAGLDALVDRGHKVAARVLPSGPLLKLLRGEPLGHPLHPIAVLVPAGAWISSVILDFVPGQQRATRTLIGVGVLAASPAALAGIAD